MIPTTRNSIPGSNKPMINIISNPVGVELIPNMPTISNIIPTSRQKIPRAFLLIAIKITLFVGLIIICICCI
jgi:hypothetical protein